jgi:hypothetical protein
MEDNQSMLVPVVFCPKVEFDFIVISKVLYLVSERKTQAKIHQIHLTLPSRHWRENPATKPNLKINEGKLEFLYFFTFKQI